MKRTRRFLAWIVGWIAFAILSWLAYALVKAFVEIIWLDVPPSTALRIGGS